MCRHLAFVGPEEPIGRLLVEPPHCLYRQSWAPRHQRYGTVNADGFDVGWYAAGDAVPARYRPGPIWADQSFTDLPRVVSTPRRSPRYGTRRWQARTRRPQRHRSPGRSLRCTYRARRRPPTHLLDRPHWATPLSLEVAVRTRSSEPGKARAPVSGIVPVSFYLCRWRLGFEQSSLGHIARVLRPSALDTSRRPPLS